MKNSRYLLIGAATVVALLITGWLLRNSIVRQVSNPILAEYDVELIDISLDALATSTASISYLKLVHAKGTTIEIEDLTLPINAADSTTKTYSARRVSIETTAPDDEAPFELALLINQFLSLPDHLAGNTINIAELEFAPYPGISDLKWAVSEAEQHLSWTIRSVGMSVRIIRSDETNFDARVTLAEQADFPNETQAIDCKLRQDEQGVSIVGHTTLGLPYLQKTGELVGILPDAVDLKSGTGDLKFAVDIPFDVAQLPAVVATVIPSSPWRIGYADESGDSTDVLVTGGSAIDIRSELSGTDWSVQRPNMALLVTNEEWGKVPFSITDLSCRSGPICSLQANVVWLDASTPAGDAAKIELSSALEVTFADNGWHVVADAIDAAVESLGLSTDLSMTSSFYLENVEASDIDGLVSASGGVFTPTIQLQTDTRTVTLPGIKGRISMQSATVTFDLVTVDVLRNGSIAGQHDLDSGAGNIALEGIELSFDETPLSTRVASDEEHFDISAGTVAFDLQADWTSAASGFLIKGQSSIQANALAGFYTDTAFVGAATNVELNYDATGLTVAPTSISVELLDMGLPIEEISANIEVDTVELSVAVANLQMSAFNGVISAAPFSFSTANDVNNVILTAREIELAELLSIKEFAAVNVTGTVSAVLPIAIADDGISIEAGMLNGEEPGGVIRYLGGSDLDDGEVSGLGLATAALSNFEYDSLTTEVNYNKAGDLKLQVQIKGRNPELDDGRPVVLNLGVENNVPQMLKSLQAARAVEDILEKRLAD